MARKAKSFTEDPGYTIARLQAIQRGIYGDKGLDQKVRWELTQDITALIQKLQRVQLELLGDNGRSQNVSEFEPADSEAPKTA